MVFSLVVLALAAVTVAAPAAAAADAAVDLWDLPAEQLRVLVAAPQVVVTRRAGALEAYCRCPVILAPHEIPEVIKQAIVAVEDKRYFSHNGIDVIALFAVAKSGFSRGASTIPMQLLKNLALYDLRQRSSRFERKATEFFHVGALTRALSKDELLAAYLNQIEFGGRDIVGLYRAARHYVGKEPRDLTLYEAALLAGMVQAPARFNPLNPATGDEAHERARLVLRLMAEQNRITAGERRRAERSGIRRGVLPEFRIQAQAFAEWVAQGWGARVVGEGETVRFFVTIEPGVQAAAERHLRDLVADGAVPAGYEAAAVMMARDGRVRAMIGAIDWGRNQFNGAVKASVQVGSLAKLPLMIAACESGRNPNSRVVDAPLLGDWPGHGGQGYKGPTTVREAIASSRNAAAVRLAFDVGIEKVAQAGRRLGLDAGAEPDAGVVLGAFSSNVLTMTAAYAAVAKGGDKVTPTGVLAAIDGRGRVRAAFFDRETTRAVAARCIAPTRSVLREVVTAGTGRAAALRRWPAYGKTGTSDGNADAWFIGWSEGRVLGVWMGRRRGTDGEGIGGKDAPARYFSRVLNEVVAADERRRGIRSPDVTASIRKPDASSKPSLPPSPIATGDKNAPRRLQAGAPPSMPLPPPRPASLWKATT
jgi:penicillin-binding protein 1A